jgi:hypothetical protein
MMIALGARGLREYVDGTAIRPILITTATSPSGKMATLEEVKENKREVAEYTQKDYLIQQHIFRTVTDQMMLQISHQTTGAVMWKEIRTLYEGKSALVKVDVRKCMLLAHCDEGGDVKAHFGELNRLCQIMAGMGAIVEDEDYAAIVMWSLPDTYQPIIFTLEAAAGYLSKVVTAQELITAVNVEYKHRLLCNPQSARKSGNAALHAGNGTRQGQGATKDTICYNCNKTGHFKTDCWAKGGRKEGQRPTGQGQRNGSKTAANTATTTPSPSPDNYAFATSAQVGRGGTIIDSGATSHFCPDCAKFITFEAIKAQDVHTADGTTISALGRGDIKVDCCSATSTSPSKTPSIHQRWRSH